MPGRVSTQLVIEGKNNSKAAFDEIARSVDSIDKRLATAGKAAVAYFSASAFAGAVKSVATMADSYALMNARLKLATASQEEFVRAQTELSRIAAAQAAPVESLYSLYGSIARPLREAGRSQSDILGITEAVAASFRVSGVSAAAASGAITQLSQALAAGALRGDEFNSVNEASPRLMQAIAAGMKVPVGSLRALAEQGKLTAEVIANALISQLGALKAEAATMPDTVGGALLQVEEAMTALAGSADMAPLIDSLHELRDTLKDPAVKEGLGLLLSALIKLAGLGVSAGAGLGVLGKEIGRTMAMITGEITREDEIDRLIDVKKSQIAAVPEAAAASLKEQLRLLEEEKAAMIKVQEDLAAQTQAIAEKAKDEANRLEQEREAELRKHRDNLKIVREGMIADLDKEIAASTDRLKKAAAATKSALDDQLKIRKEFADAVRQISLGGASGQASFTDIMGLKAGARQALQAGNAEGAIDQARQGIQALRQLQEAGENAYGFTGIAQEFEKMANAAAQLQVANAQAAEAASTAAVDSLLEKKKLLAQQTTISFGMDTSSVEALKAQLTTLAEQLKQQMIIPVKVLPAADMAGLGAPVGTGAVNFPGFAGGGRIRGPGTGTSDSMLAWVSNGEYMIKAAAVQRYGSSFLDRINSMNLPRFAEGGLISAASSNAGAGAYLGSIDLNLPGGVSLPGLGVPGSQMHELRRLQKKFGRTRA